MASIDMAERELPLIQRGTIDTCFEEGHYEYGIGVLDKLRGQRYKPFPLHMRQLLYISLYPPPSNPSKRMDRADAPLPSPQKVQLQRQKDDLWPNPESRPLAIALLKAFAGTNAPESLMRGLPFYSYEDNDGAMDVDPFREEKITDERAEDNSPLKNEVLAMQELKDCWELLRGGIVKRKQVDRCRPDGMVANSEPEDDGVVGPYAWPVLEWLIRVFENDERRAVKEGQAPHSALLLCQIPPPRAKKGPRWDAEAPIKVAFACMSPLVRSIDRPHKHSDSEARLDLGIRLIVLLVNLTLTKPPLLSPSHLLRFLAMRLLNLPLPSFRAFVSELPPNQTSFKITLLENYLSQGHDPSGERTRSTGTSTTPAPRAKPRFTGRGATQGTPSPAVASTGSQDKNKDQYPIPTRDRLLTLLSSPLPPVAAPDSSDASSVSAPPSLSFTTLAALAKYHLVSALCTLHLGGDLADPRWVTTVREGKLRKCVLDGFVVREKRYGKDDIVIDNVTRQAMDNDRREVKEYMASSLEMVGLWEASSG